MVDEILLKNLREWSAFDSKAVRTWFHVYYWSRIEPEDYLETDDGSDPTRTEAAKIVINAGKEK